jgi:xylulose-5-phosphate/fructose-6-phosphate phosphoketolase
MAYAGDVPTLETLASVSHLRQHLPNLRIRVVNVVDLITLQPHEEHLRGLTHRDFDTLFTTDKPVIFAHHGYPWLIHRLTYRRTNHRNIHVCGSAVSSARTKRQPSQPAFRSPSTIWAWSSGPLQGTRWRT